MYRYEAASVGGFVQQLAVSYLRHGYWFYVTGEIPKQKDPALVDAKLLERYDVAVSKYVRCRRKRAGKANIQYLRFERFFIILATQGEHAFFELEAGSIRDARETPIRFRGYSISYKAGHPHVRIDQEEYKKLRAYFLEMATRRSAEKLTEELRGVCFEPYAPVRGQLERLLRVVNQARKRAGDELVPEEAVRRRRVPVRPLGLGGRSKTLTVESFNGRLRDECLSAHWFAGFDDARERRLDQRRNGS